MTQQHCKDECDINYILKRYEDTGSWSGDLRQPTRTFQYGDYTEIPDFIEAQNIIIEGREAFESLPARLRKRFNNNPADLLQFLSDPANRDECIELGLIEPDFAVATKDVPKRNLGVLPKEDVQEAAD